MHTGIVFVIQWIYKESDAVPLQRQAVNCIS